MASIYRHSSRKGWCVQLCLGCGARVVLWLGDITKQAAMYSARHLDQLRSHSAANATPPADSIRWAMGTSPRIKSKLVEWGLVPACNLDTYRITAWVENYCLLRTDVVEATRAKYRLAGKALTAAITDKDLRSVTQADAARFARALKGADSTKGKKIKLVKQMFAAAVDDRLIESSPFAKLTGSTAIDATRAAYITPDVAAKVLKKISSPECRLAFLLARYAGFRVPSEVYTLRIQDIDWGESSILITSPKGDRYAHRKTRLIPLFPSIRAELLTACESVNPGQTYVLNRFRTSANTTLRRQLKAAIKAAKQTIWPKIWNNLRASCRTDLEETFPIHVCDSWLGHSDAVARKHYKRVTPDHFAQAVGAVSRAVKIDE